ncbi:hypothetical protein [Marinobacterium aestuariivivens]|uniref:Uncharacterized protein n=1 Tax=Marinobacterium aestuariivivens TaxID=1698799 RepID=A0ABW2AAD9_9GAMM
MIEWGYSTTFPNERAAKLLAPSTIGTIANRIAAEMEITCCHFQTCHDHSDFGRVVYCIRVSEDLFDLFFNSPHGYRGAYYRSRGEGINANAVFISTLAPKLIARSAPGASMEELTRIRESLSSLSAKSWLAENALGLCPECEGEWGNPTDFCADIINGRWEHGDSGPQCSGRKAPQLTKIRIFGAFLDDRNNEFIPRRKRNRAQDIHSFGWS